jgi:hypothetical protein
VREISGSQDPEDCESEPSIMVRKLGKSTYLPDLEDVIIRLLRLIPVLLLCLC